MIQQLKSKLVVIVVVAITVICFFTAGIKKDTFYGDGLGYYLYLPSTFIYHNLKDPGAMPAGNGVGYGEMWYFNEMKVNKTPTGYLLDQYTYGVALMESPFFFAAHLYEKATGGLANGYSDAYNNMIKLGGLIYALMGLLLLFRILCFYFSRDTSVLTVAIIFLCTNLFWFSVFQAGMSHVILFFLYTLVIFLTIKVHSRPSAALLLLLAITTGLITLIRPVDIICLAIPLLYNVYDKESLRQKIAFLKGHLRYLPLFLLTFFILAIPQFLYWKAATGHYISYSYGDQSFHWKHPRIIEGLLYYCNGWLPYSPVMAFALAGLLLYRRINKWALCILLLLPVYIYVIYSWYCYNYINGLGSRPMIHMYPLLALSLAAFLEYALRLRPFFKGSLAAMLLFFLALNISYSHQQVLGILSSEESNMAYNYQILFRSRLSYADLATRDLAQRQPDTAQLEKTATLLQVHYNDSLSANYIRDSSGGDRYVYHMRDTDSQVPVGMVIYNKKTFGNAQFFKFSGKFMYTSAPDYWKHQVGIQWPDGIARFCGIENKIYDAADPKPIALDHFTVNKWGTMYFFIKLRRSLKDGDKIELFIRNIGKKELFMDDLTLELYKYK